MPPVQNQPAGGRGQSGPLLLLLPLLLSSFATGPAQADIHIPPDYKHKDLKQPPVITEQPESYTAFSLDDVSLPCEASGTPSPSFRWVKDGELFREAMLGLGTLTADDSEPLSFYQGKYRCYASNELGTAVSDLAELITEQTPILPKEKKVRKRVEEGESVILHCNPPKSSVQPHIHWMDKKLLHISQSERVTTALDGNLYFSNVMANDSRDDYTCNAQYVSARTILPKEPISLLVTPSNSVVRNRRPHLSRPTGTHSSLQALRGQTLTLECIPKGLPTPSVAWRRKDGNLSGSRAATMNFDRWLRFNSIAESDDGEYECKASNSQGNITHSYTVTVEAAPYWTKEPKSLLYAPGETVRLDCQAEGIPTPTVTWSINGVPVSGTDEDPRRRVNAGTLILTDVQYSDTAVFQCEANNKHGNILVNTYIYVIELPPQILTKDALVYRVTEGQTALLECSTFGSPRPKIHWESESREPVLSNPRMSQMTNGSLQVSNATREDSNLYTCSVHHSKLNISAQLEVLNRTVILNPPQHLRVTLGELVILQCQAQVDPQISNTLMIQWRKNTQKIMESNDKYTVSEDGSLKITNAQTDDSGSYTCEVITELDMEKATGSVTVVAAPDPPQALQLSEQAERSVTLSWTPGDEHNSPVFEYVIEMMEEQQSDRARWEESARVAGDISHMEIPLLPFCTYRFQVIAVNDIGKSDPSPPSESYSTPAAAPDRNPESVRSESPDPGSMVVMWEEMDKRDFNGPGFKYKVSWRRAAGAGPHWDHSYVSRPLFVVNDTGTYTAFEVKVQAVNELGDAPAPVSKIGHSGEDFPLEAPSGVQVTLSNSTAAITVRWNAVSKESVRGNLLGYKIHLRRLGPLGGHGHRALGKRALKAERATERATVAEAESRLVVVYGGKKMEEELTGLQFYSSYELSITAFNSKGEGPHSPSHPFNTPEGVPDPPIFLGFESPSETELTLHWRAPDQPNGVLTGYLLQYQEIVDGSDGAGGEVQVERIYDATVTHFTLENLDPQSRYLFYLRGRTAAGAGKPIKREGATLLDGAPPTNISMTVGETYVNLSWVPGERYRNVGFNIHYLRKSAGGQWEKSEQVNSNQAFYQLPGLQPGTQYRLQILFSNSTYWDQEIQTNGPELSEVHNGFATQGWFIGLISAIVLLLLVLLILCFIKRSKGGKYSVKDKEEGQVDSEARPMKDETFGEYRSLESDNEEKRSASQPSICGVESKLGSEDSLAEYGDSVDIQFNEDGSFIGQYSGRKEPPGHGGHDSSGATSPVNPNTMPPPPSISFPNSETGILEPGN